MKNAFLVLACLLSLSFYAQDKGIIKGNITDLESNNEPLLFADIALQGTDLKTRTNLSGNFKIVDIVPGKYTMEVSFLGYETLSLPIVVDENAVIEIQKGLFAKSISLNPLVLADLETISGDNALASSGRSMPD